jgi:hypothetical protein
MADRRPQGITKLNIDLSDDDRSERIDVKNTRRSIPAPGSAQLPNQVESMQKTTRSSDLFQRTYRASTSSEALFMSPTSRMINDRSPQPESNQAAGLPEPL